MEQVDKPVVGGIARLINRARIETRYEEWQALLVKGIARLINRARIETQRDGWHVIGTDRIARLINRARIETFTLSRKAGRIIVSPGS